MKNTRPATTSTRYSVKTTRMCPRLGRGVDGRKTADVVKIAWRGVHFARTADALSHWRGVGHHRSDGTSLARAQADGLSNL